MEAFRSITLVLCAIITLLMHRANAEIQQSCSQVMMSPGDDNYYKLLACQLHESALMLAQLGTLVTDGIERLMFTQGVVPDSNDDDGQALEKRKHEYLRFGKRKHEYLRFGKRKHEYLRFGRK